MPLDPQQSTLNLASLLRWARRQRASYCQARGEVLIERAMKAAWNDDALRQVIAERIAGLYAQMTAVERLAEHVALIRSWLLQGRTDPWIAHQLEVTVEQLDAFRQVRGFAPANPSWNPKQEEPTHG